MDLSNVKIGDVRTFFGKYVYPTRIDGVSVMCMSVNGRNIFNNDRVVFIVRDYGRRPNYTQEELITARVVDVHAHDLGRTRYLFERIDTEEGGEGLPLDV